MVTGTDYLIHDDIQSRLAGCTDPISNNLNLQRVALSLTLHEILNHAFMLSIFVLFFAKIRIIVICFVKICVCIEHKTVIKCSKRVILIIKNNNTGGLALSSSIICSVRFSLF